MLESRLKAKLDSLSEHTSTKNYSLRGIESLDDISVVCAGAKVRRDAPGACSGIHSGAC